ncbi:MAG TPA: PIN domain-containing protein [Polyangia bacterium]
MILVDTGAFYALADRADRHHAAAVACLRELDDRLATHPLIAAEAWYLLESRLGRHAARRFTEQLAGGSVDLLLVEAADYAAALAIEQRYENLGLGLTDAVSLALCNRERIATVFTFDRKDFGAFRPARGRALRLVPQAL